MPALSKANFPDERELQWAFIQATGPGGQHVNKAATAVQLRFDAGKSPSLAGGVRQRLIRLAGRRCTREGIIVITARRFRSQEQNRQDALQRLVQLIEAEASPPRPRRPTKPTASSILRRKQGKIQRSRTKGLRKPVSRGEGD